MADLEQQRVRRHGHPDAGVRRDLRRVESLLADGDALLPADRAVHEREGDGKVPPRVVSVEPRPPEPPQRGPPGDSAVRRQDRRRLHDPLLDRVGRGRRNIETSARTPPGSPSRLHPGRPRTSAAVDPHRPYDLARQPQGALSGSERRHPPIVLRAAPLPPTSSTGPYRIVPDVWVALLPADPTQTSGTMSPGGMAGW